MPQLLWPPVVCRVGWTAQRWHKLSLLKIFLSQSRSFCPGRGHSESTDTGFPHNIPCTLAAHPNTPLGSSLHTGGGNSCQRAKHRLELTTQNPAPQYLSTMSRAGPRARGSFNQEPRSSNKLVVIMQVRGPVRKASPRSRSRWTRAIAKLETNNPSAQFKPD